MPFRELAQPLRGIIPPLVTPLTSAAELDEPALRRLVSHVLDGGVHGVFLLGTCGEGPSLSLSLRSQLIRQVCQQVDGCVPVLVNISDTALGSVVDLAAEATDAGADALVMTPPYYYPINQQELTKFILQVVEQVELPLVLYNMPGLTRVSFELATLERLLEEEHIVALKDSSGDLEYFEQVQKLIAKRPDWNLLMGPEELLVCSLELGGDGGVAGGANICPQLFVKLYDAAVAGDAEQLQSLQEQVTRLGKIYQLERGVVDAGSVIRALKSALSVLGICDDHVATPLAGPTSETKHQIAEVLEQLDDTSLFTPCVKPAHPLPHGPPRP